LEPGEGICRLARLIAVARIGTEQPYLARILVLDGHSAAALAFTRSAGRAKHWVAVGSNIGLFAPAKLSRFCSVAFDYPVSTDDADIFVEAVLKFVRQNSIDLVIPITDWTVQPLSELRQVFDGVCKVVLPPRSAVALAGDKYRTVELAATLGIAVPATQLVTGVEQIQPLRDWQFPVVVKDRFSVRQVQRKTVFGSVAYAFDEHELRRKVEDRLQVAGDVLIQKFVAGIGVGFSCFVTGKTVSLPFAWKRIREIDPRGSASSCRQAIVVDDHLFNVSSRLIQATGFEGIAMVEYKLASDGSLTLMEINGRPWGSIALPIASGIDYPEYLIRWYLAGTAPPSTKHYREGTVARRLIGELGHLANIRKGRPANWPGPYPSFWSSLLRIAVPWYPGLHYDEIWMSDLRPGMAELKNWLRARYRRVVRNGSNLP
jgi:predicted ATP-grasp superfamily ATP-dependent carboligase